MPYADRKRRLEYSREWNHKNYLLNHEIEKKRIKERKGKISLWFNKYKSTQKCAICSESESVCLDFHHLDASQKDFDVGTFRTRGWGIKRIIKEISKCVVLCANCHRKYHAGKIHL